MLHYFSCSRGVIPPNTIMANEDAILKPVYSNVVLCKVAGVVRSIIGHECASIGGETFGGRQSRV